MLLQDNQGKEAFTFKQALCVGAGNYSPPTTFRLCINPFGISICQESISNWHDVGR